MELSTIDYVVLVVEDVQRALNFYCGLGLSLSHHSPSYAQIDAGTTRLGLFHRAAMSETLGFEVGRPLSTSPEFEIGFKVGDVDAAFAEMLSAGAAGVCEPTDRSWGQRTAYVRDPDGHLIELAQDVA